MKQTPPLPPEFPTTKREGPPGFDSKEEKYSRLGLQGPLESFESTAIMPLIEEALKDAGIDPLDYTPGRYTYEHHASHYGLLATEPDATLHQTEISPIVQAIIERIESGAIVERDVEYGTVRLHPWTLYPEEGVTQEPNAHLTSSMLGIDIIELSDSETGEILAYASGLSSDGGREGYAILSTNDVTAGHEPYGKK